MRAITCFLVLAAIDLAVEHHLSPDRTSTDWRMPRTRPTSDLDTGLARLRGAPKDRPLVAFVGGSPAWGDAVGSASEAVPARLEWLAAQAGGHAQVVNLACNGQLVGDSYFLARRAATEGADLVVVQVTYHNFGRTARDGARQRYPELPALTGVPVSRKVANVLATDPTTLPDVTGSVERWLRSRWFLYGRRERIAVRLFGDTPEQRLFRAAGGLGEADVVALEDGEGPVPASFVDLDPGMQSVMADEWATDTAFRLSSRDSEVRMLRILCSELEAQGTDVVVYLAPVNLHGLAETGMLDEALFTDNVSALEKVVAGTGARFLDLNAPEPLPSETFADISHTTAEGCDLTARRLLAGATEELGVRR